MKRYSVSGKTNIFKKIGLVEFFSALNPFFMSLSLTKKSHWSYFLEALESSWRKLGATFLTVKIMWDALRDLVPFVQFQKGEKDPFGVLLLVTPSSSFWNCTNGTRSRNTSQWVWHRMDEKEFPPKHLAEVVYLSCLQECSRHA